MPRGPDLSEIFASLSSGATRPLYAVVGEDAGLREEIVGRVRRAVFGDSPPGPGQVIFGPPDPARPSSAPRLAEVMDEVRTASLFADRKLVLVRGAESLSGGKTGGDEAARLTAALESYLGFPAPGTVLLLEMEKLDKRTALAKLLARSGGLVEMPRLYSTRYGEEAASMSSSMGRLLAGMAADRGLRLSDGAGCRLLELADGEVGYLRAELDKLAGYLGGRKREVTAQDVDELASTGASEVLPMVRNALAGRTRSALRAAERAFDRGIENFGRAVWDESAIALAAVNAVGRELRTAERAILNGGRCPPARSGKALPPQVARPIEAAARRLRGTPLERAYRLTLEADLALKSDSGRSPRGIVEELLVSLSAGEVPSGRG